MAYLAAASLICILAWFPVVLSLPLRAHMLAYLPTPLIDPHTASSSFSLVHPSSRPPLLPSLRQIRAVGLVSRLHYMRGSSSQWCLCTPRGGNGDQETSGTSGGKDVDMVENTLQIMSEEDTGQVFWGGLFFEGGLGVVAIGLSYIFNASLGLSAGSTSPLWATFLGVAWSLPLVGGLLLLRTFKKESLMDVQRLVWAFADKIFRSRNVAEIALFCAAAGVGEELLFRALLQQSVANAFGVVPAFLVTAVAFGAVHFLSTTYFWLACIASAVLSASYAATGNSILVPIVAHAVYDFAAVQIALASPRPPPRVK